MVQFTVVATAIIVKENRFLVLRRAMSEEMFPGYWTVPGGKLENSDFEAISPNEQGLRYEILEHLVKREVREETCLEISNIRYLTSLAYQKKSGVALCISFVADYAGGTLDISGEPDHTDAKWVSLKEAGDVKLVKGIFEEIIMAHDLIHGRKLKPWTEYEKEAKK